MRKIPFAGPDISHVEEAYVVEAVRHGWYDNHSVHINKLQEALCAYLGVSYCLPTQTGTAALECAVDAIDSNQLVLCPAFSWVATANAINAGLESDIAFCDIEEDTWCISPKDARKAMENHRITSIMAVHTYGVPADMTELMKLELPIIEDACPALGSKHQDQFCGTIGAIGCFSFHGAKIAVGGEGGALVTNKKYYHGCAEEYANHCRTDAQGTFWSDGCGHQFTMSNLVAALVLAQVERIEELLCKKQRIWDWYQQRIGNHPKLKWQTARMGDDSNHAYPSAMLVGSPKISRDHLIQRLKQRNIHARPTFPNMQNFPQFMGAYRRKTAVADYVAINGFSLPSPMNMTEDDVDFVCKAIDDLI